MTVSDLEKSDMYDWRVHALMTWIDKNKQSNTRLSMDTLSKAGHLDQYHYLGLACNDEVIKILDLNSSVKILDVGCGIGGPARYLAWKSGCSVVGIDIQSQLVDTGNSVTRLVGLENQVTLVSGNVCDNLPLYVENEKFDAFMSLLVILHIANREQLFDRLYNQVKDGGVFLIEDMVALDATFSPEETRIAKDVIGSPLLPTMDEYRRHLETAGFVDVEFEMLTQDWIKWCIDRSDQYEASKEVQIKNFGEKIYTQRSLFYADVKTLFLSGKLGGVRITGRKPSRMEMSLRNHRMRRINHQQKITQTTILEN